MAEALASDVIPPAYHINENDKRGLVMVITTVTVSFVMLCLAVRIYIRTNVREWKRDDSLLAVATLFSFFQAATVYLQVHEGLGLKRLDPARLSQLGKANFAQQLLYIFTLFLSKVVVCLLYLRLTAGKKHAALAYATMALCAAWIVTSFVMVSISCNPVQFFTLGLGICGDITWRWVVIGVFDCLTELLIFFNAIYLVAGLHMAVRLKIVVILAFSIRLPVIIASILRMKYIRAFTDPNVDPTFLSAYSVISGQFQLDFAIISTTISCLGPFLRPFENAGGGGSSYRRRYYAEQQYRDQYPSYNQRSRGGTGNGRSFNDNISFGTAIQMGPISNHHSGGSGKAAAVATGSSSAAGAAGAMGQHKQYNHHQHRQKPSLGHRGSAFFFGAGSPPDQPGKMSLDLRPDFCEHEAAAGRGSAVGGSGAIGMMAELDQLSLESNDSKRMIIAKKTVVRVEREGEEEEEEGDLPVLST
ncbi:hypothetical protein UCDDS831_g03322 [Diplodia seriata]|uniref:Rhodopsin domain-containing protein n=1 Tax=Diplodia seriata TaxID=420778 RepID=A0A0G2GH12_9PEZI|nr:hypothetical protein UCDDS831_g03322 [Diplodia seriata]